jgi:predicted P-loop ATPase
LKWDGKCRIDNLFIKYFGAKNKNPLEAILAGRYFMIGLAARGYKPGCKMDYSPVLEGDQGLLKTSALRILGGEFYGEGMPKIGEKDSQVFLAGKMLIEIAETSAMRKAEVNHVKAFLTYQTDDFRAPYGHRNKKVPRSALFAITTNATDWNKDETGGRRFWPIEVGDVDLEGLKADRDQLFAEAVVCYKAGEPWWPTPDQQAKVFTPAQDDRLDRDAFDEVVADLLKGRTTARLPEIAKELPLAFASWHGKLRAAMSKAGWRATQERVDGGEPIRFWVPRRSFKAEPETEPEPETVDDELPF